MSWLAPVASVRVSRVIYSYDVLRPQTPDEAIPLGVFVDLRIERVLYGLGLMARASVAERELERVGGLARRLVAQPFEYLNSEFDRVIDADDRDKAFARLALDHSSALRISAPTERTVELPRHLRIKQNRDDALGIWTKDALISRLNEEFWALLDEHWPNSNYGGHRREDVKLAA